MKNHVVFERTGGRLQGYLNIAVNRDHYYGSLEDATRMSEKQAHSLAAKLNRQVYRGSSTVYGVTTDDRPAC